MSKMQQSKENSDTAGCGATDTSLRHDCLMLHLTLDTAKWVTEVFWYRIDISIC